MLIVHKTNRVTPTEKGREEYYCSPYYYQPLEFKLESGSSVRLNNYIYYRFLISDGPVIDSKYQIGTMEDSPFVSWKAVLGFDYPLKDNRLHDCIHEHIRGELFQVPNQLQGIEKLVSLQCVPKSTWSTVSKVGNLIYADKEQQIVDMPASFASNKTTYINVLPGQIVKAIAMSKSYGSPTMYDYIYGDIGSVYIGSGADLGWVTSTDRHIYAIVTHRFDSNRQPITRVTFCFIEPYYSTYWHWRTARFDLGGLMSIHDPILHSWLTKNVPDPTSFSSGSSSFVPLGASEPVELWDRMPRNALQILHNRYYTDDVRFNGRYATAVASQQALLNEKALDINTLMYLKDFTEISKLITSYSQLVTKGIDPKTVSGAFLASYYGVRLTVKDTKKIIRSAKRLKHLVETQYAYSYGKHEFSYDGVKYRANVSIAYGQYDQKWLRFLSALSSLDLLPTPSRLWDMMAYSFVVDWFLPVSSMLETYDALLRYVLVANYRSCRSVETTVELAPSNFNRYEESLTMVGSAEYVLYDRKYSADPQLPLPWLSLTELEASWNTTRFLVSGALIVQQI